MASEHLENPLEYLYEELPPEGMAAARQHLSVCPECRDALRLIRETVKTYREAPRPQPPQGIARRAAEAAFDAMTGKIAGQELDNVTVPDMEQNETGPDYTNLTEIPSSRLRRWFFHPGWAVAASVLFICSLLIHASPRNAAIAYQRPAVILHSADKRMAEAGAEWELLPEAVERQTLPVGRLPGIPVDAGLASQEEPTQVQPVDVQPSAVLQREMAPTPSLPDVLPENKLQPSLAKTARAASAPPSEPISPVLDEIVGQGGPDTMIEPLEQMESRVETLSELTWPESGQEDLPSLHTAPSSEAKEERGKKEFSAIGAADSSEPPYATPLQSEDTNAENTIEDEPDPAAAYVSAPVIVDLQQWEPPQIVTRPTPIDVEKLTRELIILAGLQIGHGEFEDARTIIARLRRFDPEAADELTAMIEQAESVEQEAQPAGETANAETTTTGHGAAFSAQLYDESGPGLEMHGKKEKDEADKYFRSPVENSVHASPQEIEETNAFPDPADIDDTGEPSTDFIGTGTGAFLFPEVEKPTPDAFAPTLWEQSGHDRPLRNWPSSRRRPLFTTDPYWRD